MNKFNIIATILIVLSFIFIGLSIYFMGVSQDHLELSNKLYYCSAVIDTAEFCSCIEEAYEMAPTPMIDVSGTSQEVKLALKDLVHESCK